MMLKKNSLVLLFLFMLHSLCSFSESYREKYADVIEHYQKKVADTLKVKAALYLIDNMDGHKSPEGKALDKYVIRIRQMRPRSNECRISEIKFTPVSDGNNIQNGHTYELWGFDNYWKKLGHCIAQSRESITFHNVPTNMLLLLKDKTKGVEERIFLYNNKQLWY